MPPPGWIQARWPDEVIEYLKSGLVTDLSLDHELGDDQHGTGHDEIIWIEEAVVTEGFRPPSITVHSANRPSRQRMMSRVAAIQRH